MHTRVLYDDNGKPVKEDDDFMEDFYRIMLLNTEYYKGEYTEEELEDMDLDDDRQNSSGNKVTGY